MRPLTAFAILAGLCSPAIATEIAGFTQGQWIGAAHTSDAGDFTFCDAGTLFKNGTSLILEKDRASAWSASLSDERWHLPPGYEYHLQVKFDDGPWLLLDSFARSTSLLRIALPADGTMLEMFRRAQSIQINSGSFHKRYDLVGSTDAMSRLDSCVDDQLLREKHSRETAKATTEALTTFATIGLALGLAPLTPAIVIGVLASPNYKPVMAPSSAVGAAPDAPAETADATSDASPTIEPTVVSLREEAGTFMVPVQVNGITTVDFTVDSGASSVVIPADVFKRLMAGGTISAADFLGETTAQLADGSVVVQRRVRIRSLQIGSTILRDIVASVSPEGASPLLGQTFLGRFSSWSMDNGKHVLILQQAGAD